jgi:hypothetical protein
LYLWGYLSFGCGRFARSRKSSVLSSIRIRGSREILRERHVDRTYVAVPGIADNNAELRGIGYDANLSSIRDPALQNALEGRAVEIRVKSSVISLKNMTRVVELKKDGLYCAGPAAFPLPHLDFVQIEMDLNTQSWAARIF